MFNFARQLIALLVLMVAFAAPAAADGLFGPLGPAQALSAADQGSPYLAVRRSRDVAIDAAYLAARVAPLGLDEAEGRLDSAPPPATVRIELFPGVVADFERTSISEAFGGGFIWTGEAGGDNPAYADLVIRDGRITGHVSLIGGEVRSYRIDPLPVNGAHRISELDSDAFPAELHIHEHDDDDHGPDHGHDDDGQDHDGDHGQDQGAAAPDGAEADDTIIDVLIVYTSSAANSVSDVQAQANLAISLSNSGFTRSNVLIQFRLVGTHLVSGYSEGGFSTMLNHLTDGTLSQFQTVHNLRNSTGADLVGMLVANGDSCGIGWAPTTPSSSTANLGFSVTSIGCITNYSFTHELGHNMGLLHDRYVHNPAPNSQYNFGFVSLPGGWRDMMAYANQCSANGISCPRINNFSNPNVSHQGRATGIPQNSPGAADGARRLNETRAAVAAYRPTATVIPGLVATTTTLTGPATSTLGQSVTFTARVARVTGNGTPAGTVSFRRGGVQFGTGVLSGGQATLTTSSLAAGTHQITAVYLGNTTYRTSTSSTLTHVITAASAPANDNFVNRITIPSPGFVTGTNVNATRETGEPTTIAGRSNNNSVWWRFTPSASGVLTIDTVGSSFDTILAVYTGSAVNALTVMAANDDIDLGGGNYQSRVQFNATGGVSYAIAVAGFGSAQGSIRVNVALVPSGPVGTTTTLSGPTSGQQGQSLTFVAQVSPTAGGGTPTGTVSFRRGGTQFATASLSGGSASVTTSALPVGTHQITAQFQGTAAFATSTSAARTVTITAVAVDPVQFFGGGSVFGFSDACRPAWSRVSEAVRARYSPSELNGGPPSELAIVWPTGSEHVSLWGNMLPSEQFRGGTGRQMWSYFVFYPLRPLVRVVQRQVTQPLNASLANAQELVLRLRVQNFGAIPGCTAVVTVTLRRN